MPTPFDRIQELRRELAGCCLTRRERAAAERALARLRSEQAVLDRAFEALLAEAVPPD